MPRKSPSKRSRSKRRSPKMSSGTGYCLGCKATRKIEHPKKKKTSNGRHMIQGSCGRCGTKMSRFVSA